MPRGIPCVAAYLHIFIKTRPQHEAAAIFLSGFACNNTLQLQRMLMSLPGGTGKFFRCIFYASSVVGNCWPLKLTFNFMITLVGYYLYFELYVCEMQTRNTDRSEFFYSFRDQSRAVTFECLKFISRSTFIPSPVSRN